MRCGCSCTRPLRQWAVPTSVQWVSGWRLVDRSAGIQIQLCLSPRIQLFFWTLNLELQHQTSDWPLSQSHPSWCTVLMWTNDQSYPLEIRWKFSRDQDSGKCPSVCVIELSMVPRLRAASWNHRRGCMLHGPELAGWLQDLVHPQVQCTNGLNSSPWGLLNCASFLCTEFMYS